MTRQTRTDQQARLQEGTDSTTPSNKTKRTRSRKTTSSNPTDIKSAKFNPSASELTRTWSTYANSIACINTFPNGVTYASHIAKNRSIGKLEKDLKEEKFLPAHFHLRFRDTRNYLLPEGKYYLFKENYLHSLERRLSQLHEQGILSSTVVYFGTTNDPFSSFHKKFDITMGCLKLLEHYRPAKVVLQTRSPMVISALPFLKAMGDKAVVGIPVETRLEKSVARYTPGLPKISDRLLAATGLRKQGITVNLIVSPILPYGDAYRGAWDFADLLDKHADYISLGCLAFGEANDESQLKSLPVVQKLVADRNYQILRPHAYRHLYNALKVLAPHKLELPVSDNSGPNQMSLFA